MACITRFDFAASVSPSSLPRNGGNDLPRQAVFIFEPTASFLSPAVGKLVPQLVDLLLRLTAHKERNGWRERKLWGAVQRKEVLSVELESRGHHRPLWTRPGVSRARNPYYL